MYSFRVLLLDSGMVAIAVVTSRWTVSWPLRHAAPWMMTDKHHKNEAFPLVKSIRRYLRNGLVIIFGLGLT